MNNSGQVDDLSSYACRNEYDPFGAGHGCSSISSGLGKLVKVTFILVTFRYLIMGSSAAGC